MSKKIITREELLKPKLEGLRQIAAIVKRTLGPGGLPIVIQRVGQTLEGLPIGPKITKDGVSVAEECSSPNEAEDVIIQAVKAICKRTVDVAGDGTTTALVLGEAIVNVTEEILAADKSLNPQLVKESIEEATRYVLEKLRKTAIKVKDNKMIRQVATISANGDTDIGDIIGQAFEKVGAEGVITVDEGYTSGVTLDVVEGYQFNRGAEARNNYFNNKDQTKFEVEQCRVVLFDGNVHNFMDLVPALKLLADIGDDGKPKKKMPPVLFIANQFSPEVLQWLLIQKIEGGMNFCAVQGPNTTHVRTSYYDDLAVYTGGTRLGNGARNIQAIEEDDIGLVAKVIVDKYKTTLYEGQGDEESILERVGQLKAAKAQAESPYDAQVINDRIASLTNGIAKIGVGGVTELEIKEKYDRIEDALNAARAAIQEGVVPGGGSTLLRIAQRMNADKGVGYKILQQALQVPFYQILDNVGMSNSDISHTAVLVNRNKNKVFDARNKQIKNALKVGIIDPVKVTRTALENAVSIATLLSTAGGAIIYTRDK